MKRIMLGIIIALLCFSASVNANELTFEPIGGGKFIYCNNPEGIVDDIILNGSTPRWIMNNENLPSDLYYIYISHFNYTGGGKRGYEIELDMAMTAKTDSEIVIHKAFFETPKNYAFYENGVKKVSETDWGQLQVCSNMLGIPMCDIRGDDIYYPEEFDSVTLQIPAGDTVWLSKYLSGYSAVQFGKGVHIQALVEITDGVMDFNVGAIKSGTLIGNRENIPDDAAFGEYRWDYTLKGIADTLPEVKSDIEYTITEETADNERIPVFLKNQYIPDGHTVTAWYTQLNPQNDIWSKTTAAETDIVTLRYKDDGKLNFYGDSVPLEKKDNIWTFDTKRSAVRQYEARFNAGSAETFEPNFLLDVGADNHGWACNIGNYGVATTYKMKVENKTQNEKYCSLVITAASEIIAYATDSDGQKAYAYVKDLTSEKVTDNMLSYKIPPNSTETFEFSLILPVNYNGGIKNELVITNENIQSVDFKEKKESIDFERNQNDYRQADVIYGKPLNEIEEVATDIFDGVRSGYEYLKGKELSLVRWCAWDGAPNWYYNLWGYVNTVYLLDENGELVSSYEFSSLPCGASYDGDKFYVKTAQDGVFSTTDGINWIQEYVELPEYVPYYDLDKASFWAIPELKSGWDVGIRLNMRGKNGYDFASGITREEFCNLAADLLKLLDCDFTDESEITFSDTENPNVYKLASIGVIMGYPDGSFRPGELLTREMAAAILTRFAEFITGSAIPKTEYVYSDYDGISDWAKESVMKAYSLGIMKGIGNDMFDSQGQYSREQSAAVILRMYLECGGI